MLSYDFQLRLKRGYICGLSVYAKYYSEMLSRSKLQLRSELKTKKQSAREAIKEENTVKCAFDLHWFRHLQVRRAKLRTFGPPKPRFAHLIVCRGFSLWTNRTSDQEAGEKAAPRTVEEKDARAQTQLSQVIPLQSLVARLLAGCEIPECAYMAMGR